jgi:hypothetical protein
MRCGFHPDAKGVMCLRFTNKIFHGEDGDFPCCDRCWSQAEQIRRGNSREWLDKFEAIEGKDDDHRS